jgi:hypothetical protein
MSSETTAAATQNYAKGPLQVTLAIGSLALACVIVIALVIKEKFAHKFPRTRSAANAGAVMAINGVCWVIDNLYGAGDYLALGWKKTFAK